MSLKAAVIGCGNIGGDFTNDYTHEKIGIHTHAEAYHICPDTELLAFSDNDKTKTELAGKHWGVKQTYSDADRMLDEVRPEIVSICTSNQSHFSLCSLVMDFPEVKGILLEKPISSNLKEGEQLIKKANERGVILAVNYSRRYSAAFQTLREMIAKSELGEIQKIHGYYTKGIVHNGTHWIDLLKFLFGEISFAKAISQSQDNLDDPEIDVCFTMENGVRAVLQSLGSEHYSLFEMDILGTGGRIQIRDSGNSIKHFSVKNSPYYRGYQTLSSGQELFDQPMKDMTLHAITDLVNAIQAKRKPLCTPEDALTTLAWALELSERG